MPFNLKINCGGSADSGFVADQDYTGGTTYAWNSTYNTSGLTNPGSKAVYDNVRYAINGTSFTYTITGLDQSKSHKLRFHFVGHSSGRTMSVSINGTQVLTSYDPYVEAGNQTNKPTIPEFIKFPNGSNEFVLLFTSTSSNAELCGIEVIEVEPPVITTTTLADVRVGDSANQTIVVTDGVPDYEFEVISGDLPPGRSLDDSTGVISGTYLADGNYSFTIQVTDDESNTDTQLYSQTVNKIESIWTKRLLIPLSGLEAWHTLDLSTDGSEILDFANNGKDLVCASNQPVLQQDKLNGHPALYFDGTKNPLICPNGFTARHIFILASFEDATFPSTYGGLISDQDTNGLLVGNPSETRFFDLGYEEFGDYQYRIADVAHDEDSQSAPMSSKFKLIEVSYDTGWTLDGLQIGRDRTIADRLWKGWFVESAVYNRVLSEYERCMMYQYFAMKFHIWQENSDGLFIFPFPTNKSSSSNRGQEFYLSEPYDGDPKALIRGSKRRAFNLPFEIRRQQELEAAEEFHDVHYPNPSNHFVLRDYKYYPAKDRICRITSPFAEGGSNVTFRFNYSFDAIEV